MTVNPAASTPVSAPPDADTMVGGGKNAASYFVPEVSCSWVGLKPTGDSRWLVAHWIIICSPLLLLTSRCSAVMNRRLLLLREVACRSSKEKAAPHAGDQLSQRRDTVVPDVLGQWRSRPDTLSSALRGRRRYLRFLTEYKDTAHTLIFPPGRKTTMLR